jgi:hypothetical protein
MPFVRVTNSSVELIDEQSYRVIRTIATSALSADRNQKTSQSVIVHTDGRVVLYDDDARVVRTLTTGGASGVFSGDDIIIRKGSGHTEVWSADGRLIRTMDSGLNLKKLISKLGI